jgi:hypothetical protein
MESQVWTPITHHGAKTRNFTPELGFLMRGLKSEICTHTWWLLREAWAKNPDAFTIDEGCLETGALRLTYKISHNFSQVYLVHYHTDRLNRTIYDKIECEDCFRIMRPIVVFNTGIQR